MKSRTLATSLSLAGLLAGCHSQQATGVISGTVLTAGGQPAAAARVAIDGMNGRVTLTDASGLFLLAGVKAGSHSVYALQNNSAAVAQVQLAGGETASTGPVTLESCTTITANGGVYSPPAGASSSAPTSSGGANASPAGTPVTLPGGQVPCTTTPPPPPPANVSYSAIVSAQSFATITNGTAIFGSGWDDNQNVGFDFMISGDVTSSGTWTASLPAATTSAGASMNLYTADGYVYTLVSGSLKVATSPAPVTTAPPTPCPQPSATPVTSNGATGSAPGGCGVPQGSVVFTFVADNLTFDWVPGNGSVDSTHTATAPSATASGNAFLFYPPAPPTADVVIPDFVADWSEFSLCENCGTAGTSELFVYAFDSADSADLSLTMDLSDLLPPSGSTTSTISPGNPDVSGSVEYFPGSNDWFYSLDHITVFVATSLVAADQQISMTLTDGVFDYVSAIGVPIPVAGQPSTGTAAPQDRVSSTVGGGSNGGSPISTSALTLTIDTGTLSGTVQTYGCVPPVTGANGSSGAGNGSAAGSGSSTGGAPACPAPTATPVGSPAPTPVVGSNG